MINMVTEEQMNESILRDKIYPFFTDGIAIGFRIMAKNTSSTEVKLEDVTASNGLIELIFLDNGKSQVLGRFVMDRNTAENLVNTLNDSIRKFDAAMAKGGITSILPKKQATPAQSNSSYR